MAVYRYKVSFISKSAPLRFGTNHKRPDTEHVNDVTARGSEQ